MKTNSSFEKKFSIVLVAILCACFVAVFAATLFASTAATIGNNSLNVADAALAENNNLTNSGGTVGAANPICLDIDSENRVLSLEDFGFPGPEKKKINTTLKTATSSNFQASINRDGLGTDGPTFYIDGGDNVWEYGVTRFRYAAMLYSSINITLASEDSPLDMVINNNTMYSIRATVSADFSVNEGGGTAHHTVTSKLGLASSKEGYSADALSNTIGSWSSDSIETKNGTKTGKLSVTHDVVGRTLTIATSMNYKHSTSVGIGKCNCYTSLSNIAISLEIVKTNPTYSESTVKIDGGAPVVSSVYANLENLYKKGNSGSGFEPYVTADSLTNATVYDSDIAAILRGNLDSVVYGDGVLKSYNGISLGKINNKDYYKYAQIEYTDTYNYLFNKKTLQELMIDDLTETNGYQNYSGAGEKYVSSITNTIFWADRDPDVCSGIKSVIINSQTEGETKINVYSNTLGSEFMSIDGVVSGYVNVVKENASRIIVQLYFYDNVEVKIKVYDYGDEESTEQSIKVSGIDKVKPSSAPTFYTEDDVISYDYDLPNWVRTRELKVSVEDDYVDDDRVAGGTFSPYVWFYTVRKNTSSLTGIVSNPTYSTYKEIKEAGLRPIAVSEGNRFLEFKYDFVNGEAYGILKESRISDPTSSNCKGPGYYRFKFYVCDLAGNVSSITKEFYVKVDNETPYATTTLVDSKGQKITSDWSNLGEILQVHLLKKNISGNTLQFETGGGVYNTLVIDETGKIVSLNDEEVNSYQKDVDINGKFKIAQVTITTESDNLGGLIIQFSIPKTRMFAWDVNFKMYAGQHIEEYQDSSANRVEVSFDGIVFQEGEKTYSGINFESGIKVYIDDTNPENPNLPFDESECLVEILDSSQFNVSNPNDIVKTDRKWFTKSDLKFETSILFEDEIVDSEDFAKDLKVYYAVKTVKTSADLGKLKEFVDNYNEISFDEDTLKKYFGEGFKDLNGENFDYGEYECDVDLVKTDGANMRIVFVWAVDQAGNRSAQIKMYYVLADPTKYTVKSSTYKNDIATSSSMILTNEDGNATTEFVRGESITMTFSLEDGFVPYLLNQIGSSKTSILTNYTPNIDWTVSEMYDENHANLIQIISVNENEISVLFMYDDPTLLSGLDKVVTLEFAYRKVVGYTLTNTFIRYTGFEVEMPLIFTEEKSVDSFKYDYKSSNGVSLDYVPVVPGKYKVKIHILDDDKNFVADNHDTVDFVDFEIVKGIATVVVNHSSSIYSQTSVSDLSYTIPEIDSAFLESIKGDSSQFKGSLKLNVANPTEEYSAIEVGSYAIVQNEEFWIEHYELTFVGEYHDVLQKEIVVDILDGSKIFGTTDLNYKFTVDYTQLNSEPLTDKVFGFGHSTSDGTILTYETSTFISREAGEDVGEYNFINNPQAFTITDKNYAIRINSLGKYTINQRTIEIDASGQEHWFKTSEAANKEGNIEALSIDYTLGVNDMYRAEILGKLALDLGSKSKVEDIPETSAYEEVYTYKITLGTIKDTENFKFVLKEENDANIYKVYVARPGTIVVSLKDDVRFELTYGATFNQDFVKFDSDKFIVDGAVEGVDFDDIQWTAKNELLQKGNANVGSYEITIKDSSLLRAGASVDTIKVDGIDSEYMLKIAPFKVYVVPAELVIEPYAENNIKTYASSEDSYKITHRIISIAGTPVYDEAGNPKLEDYNGKDLSVLEDLIAGSFARAIYTSDGSFVSFGSKNDIVSDANGVLFGSTNYYSFAVLNEFTSNDPNGNFVVKVQLDSSNRLQISPTKLVVNKKDFVGISKVYDGTDLVKYTDLVKAIDINSLLKAPNEDVEVSFVAKYESNNDSQASAVGPKLIRFTSLSLTGAQACNYTLYIVIEGTTEQLVTEETSFVIDKIINNNPSLSEYIRIFEGIISLVRTDFVVAKEYDSLTTLTRDNVSIINRENEDHKGTTVLCSLKDDMQILNGQFTDKEVSKNYKTDLELFFPLGQDAKENGVQIDQTDITIEVSLVEIDGVLGIRVYIAEIAAEIKQKTLNAKDFKSIVAIDRDYNATADVTFTYEFNDGAIVIGDEAYNNSSSIKLKGLVKDEDIEGQRMVDVGTYDVEFTGYEIENAIFNRRYKVDIASLNSFYKGVNQLSVNIDYAKLMPRVDFGTRVYEGSTVVNFKEGQIVDKSMGTTMLKTLNYTEQLIEELKHFTYDDASVLYEYTNGNVQADAEGNVVLHDVVVKNMAISVESGYEDLLKNYVVNGVRLVDDNYKAAGNFENGVTIDPYIMPNVAGLTKRLLQIFGNDIDVVDKVYDGTKNATINVKLDKSDAVTEDKEFLAVSATATYARKQVGENINVTVKISKLVLKEGKEGYEDLLNNYELVPFSTKVSRDILKRPVEFAVSFDDRIYSGEELIAKNLINYDLGSMLLTDANSYTVATENGAYYFDKDVKFTLFTKLTTSATFDANTIYYKDAAGTEVANDVHEGNFAAKVEAGLYINKFSEIEKLGTAYNPVLYNSKEKYINYELSTKSAVLLENKDFYAYQKNDGQVYYGDFESVFTKTTSESEFVDGVKYYDSQKKLVSLDKSTFDDNKGTTAWYYLDYDNIAYYFYKMPATTKYIKTSDYKLLSGENQTELSNYIVGFYIYESSDVYVISEDYTGIIDKVLTMPELRYIQGYGKVTRRSISIASVAAVNQESFSKEFDGTTKYYGVSGVDYNFSSGSIVNDIKADELKVATVDANFKTYLTGTTQVLFIATGLTTDPDTGAQNNYSSTTKSSSAIPATITKRPIYAKLLDAQMVYGSSTGSIKPQIEYYFDEACTVGIIINDKGWFVEFESFIQTIEATNDKFDYDTLEDKYKAELNSLRYSEEFSENVEGKYYKLPGTFTEPTASISFASSKPVVGDIARTYALKGGFATNFNFEPVYTDGDKSKLEVIKKVVYVIADATKTYTREYGVDLAPDAVKILIVNENGRDGVISGETFKNVYGKDTNLSVVFKKINITSTAQSYGIDAANTVTARSLISVTDGDNIGLGENEFYVAYIAKPSVESKNYDVRFGEVIYDSESKTFKYSFEGTTFTAIVPQLTIVLPQLNDVTLSANEKVVTYQKDKNHAEYLVSNLGNKDSVTIDGVSAINVKVDADGNVIAYEGKVVVTRELIANENNIPYTIEHQLGVAKLTIEKANPGLVVKNKTVEFNGTAREVTKESYYLTTSGVGYTDNDFIVEYYLNDKKVDMSKTQLIDVETYTYVVKFVSKDPNYSSEEKRALFIISPAIISVQVTTEKLIQEYIVGKEYRIDYTISDINGIGIEKSDTEFKFMKNGEVVDITRAGRYQFVIGLKSQKAEEYKSNVVFINNIGNLDLTVHEIESYNKDNDKVADLILKNTSDSILADLYTTRYVYSSNNLSEDDLYWNSVAQYMPQIEKTIGSGATLAAIVRMSLSYGINSQTLKGKEAIVTVSLPEEIPANMKGYAVYQTTSTGTLQVVKPSDYVINKDNTITYTTTYLGSLVFVKLGEEGLPAAAVGGIAGGVSAFVLLIAGAVAITLIKKKKLNANIN